MSAPLHAVIAGRTLTMAPGRVYVAGTSAGSDVVLAEPGFSGDVLRIRHWDHWTVAVLGEPELVDLDGARTSERLIHVWPGREARQVTIVSGAGRVEARFASGAAPVLADPVPARPAPGPSGDLEHRIGDRATIGREGGGATVEVPGLAVALHQATLVRVSEDAYQLSDTGRGVGTFVGGCAILWARIGPGDTFSIGASELTLARPGLVVERRRPVAAAMIVAGLSACYPGEKGLALRDLHLGLAAGEMLAVLGPSGVGKTSLFKAILGEIRVLSGSVGFRGLDLVRDLEQVRPMLGYVPQEDHLHMSLRACQVLDYAIRLRLSADITRAERRELVETMAATLRIDERLQGRVVELSGGQRKRLSIAVEAITGPSLLMLDEPTSGLDPAAARDVMGMLRSVAGGDCTVALVTHSTDQLQGVDRALLIAEGGSGAFFGPPGEVLPAFGAATYAGVMDQLRSGRTLPPPASPEPPTGVAPAAPSLSGRAREASLMRRGSRGARRLLTLAAREVALLCARGWGGLASYLAVPVLGAGLAGVMATGDGLGGRPLGNPHALQALSLLVTTVVFAGQALTYGNLVAEYQVIRRERRTGISPAAAVGAKFLVFGVVAAAQAVLVWDVFFVWHPRPPASLLGLDGRVEVLISLVLTTLASMSLGLLISACSDRLERAVGLASAAAVCQVALNGALLDLSGWSPWSVASVLLPARWGVAAGASAIDVRSITPALPADPLWHHGGDTLLLAWAVPAVMAAAFLWASCRALGRRIERDHR